MIEGKQWLACAEPSVMLETLRDRATPRKLRLFQVACCRRIWRYITYPISRSYIQLVERAADVAVSEQELLALPYDRLTDDCGARNPAVRHAYMTAGHVGYSLLAPLYSSPFPPDEIRDAARAAEGVATTMAEALNFPDDDASLQPLPGSSGRRTRRPCSPPARHLRQPVPSGVVRPRVAHGYRGGAGVADVRVARLRGDADPGGRAPGRGVRQRRHPRPLPRAGAARPRVLGRRSGARERVTCRTGPRRGHR